MAGIIRFPTSGRLQAASIPREEFQRLADLALDLVDRIVAILDAADSDADFKLGFDGEHSLGAPEGQEGQVVWLRGGDRHLEK